METEQLLFEREKTYGDYKGYASLYQQIQKAIEDKRSNLNFVQLASVDMIVSKLCRMLNGNDNYVDNWRDICGYSQRVVEYLDDMPLATDVDNVPMVRDHKRWVTLEEFNCRKEEATEAAKQPVEIGDKVFKNLSEAWKDENQSTVD